MKTRTEKRYVVYYKGEIELSAYFSEQKVLVDAYYAKEQKNYDWTFTGDIGEALLYKTKRGAIERKNLVYGDIAKVLEVEVTTTYKIGNEIK